MVTFAQNMLDLPGRMTRQVRECSYGTGRDHRCEDYTFGDSTDGNHGFKPDGTGLEDADWPRGRRHGFELALMRAGLYVGGPLMNNCLNTDNTYTQCTGFQHGNEPNIATDPYADPTAIALVAGSSLPSVAGNPFFSIGYLSYINAVPKPVTPAFSYLGLYDRPNPLTRSFTNPYALGNQELVQIRVHFSYKTNSDDADFYIQAENFGVDLGTKHYSGPSANTHGQWVNDSILCAVNNTLPFGQQLGIYVTLHDHVNNHQSAGPVLVSGVQITHADVDSASPFTGPCGYLESCIFQRVGNTLTHLAADLKYLSIHYPGAIAEWFRSGQRDRQVARFGRALLHYWRNDRFGVLNSFRYTDTPGGISNRDTPPIQGPGGATGPIESGAAGTCCNLSTISQILEEGWAQNGYPIEDFRILWKGAHPHPAFTDDTAVVDEVCAWNAGAAHGEFRRSACLVIQRTDLMLSVKGIRDVQGYQQAAVLPITAISTDNPPKISVAAHGVATGEDVWFTATNEKMNAPGTKLSASSDPTGTGSLAPRKFLATRFDANTVTVVTGAAPATAGDRGFLCSQKDYSHINAPMQITIGQMDYDVLNAAVGWAEAGGDTTSNRRSGAMLNTRDRMGEIELAATALSITTPGAAPASAYLPLVSGGVTRTIAAAVEAIAAGWRYIEVPGNGAARPTKVRITKYSSATNPGTAKAADDDVYGVRKEWKKSGDLAVLEKLADATFRFDDVATGDVPPANSMLDGYRTSPSSANAAATTLLSNKMGGAAINAGDARPASVEILLPESFVGIAISASSGDTGNACVPVVQWLWE